MLTQTIEKYYFIVLLNYNNCVDMNNIGVNPIIL